MELKGGHTTKDPRLDRIPQFDDRSRQYRIRRMMVAGEPLEKCSLRSRSWGINVWLDQGQEGRCVEFAICHDLLARPTQVAQEPLVEQILQTKGIYWPAQQEDQWPGGSYPGADPIEEGTSVLAGMKVAARLGFYGEYRWATTLAGALLALGHVGPLILGVNWYSGCYDADADGWIHVTGELEGGHAILAPAVKLVWLEKPPAGTSHDAAVAQYLDRQKSHIVLHNSWGPSWGVNGRAKLSVADFDRLRIEQGEVCIATQRYIPKTLSP